MDINNYHGTLQVPVNSGFNEKSTTSDVIQGIDLTGKTAIVTGGYNGLGLETVKTLAAAGASVIIPVRDAEKAKNHLEGIGNIQIELMDLMVPQSIDAFTKKFVASQRPLHLLINNAGIMWNPLTRDARGYESQFSTNHLGHFQLTAGLWKALAQANGARVVNVSSSGHYFSPVHFEDIHFNTRPYNKFEAYGQAKTANILFSLELDNRAKQFGVRAYSLHPGLILETGLGRHLTSSDYIELGMIDTNGNPNPEKQAAAKKIQKTIVQGAATQVWCATSPQLENIGGVYCENVDIAGYDPEFYNSGKWKNNMFALSGIAPFALDPAAAKKLWSLSEDMTGVRFPIE